MKTRWSLSLIACAALLLVVGCSSGKKAQQTDEPATDEQTAAAEQAEQDMTDEPAAEEEPTASKTELASCTGGNVPMGAKSCLLDLGTGSDSYWSDSDGVDPGTAGCHYEYEDEACETLKSERTFGEFCLDDDRLVESNPGADECHKHGVDRGKPDVVSCTKWCQDENGTNGRCRSNVPAEGSGGKCVSARCECEDAT